MTFAVINIDSVQALLAFLYKYTWHTTLKFGIISMSNIMYQKFMMLWNESKSWLQKYELAFMKLDKIC